VRLRLWHFDQLAFHTHQHVIYKVRMSCGVQISCILHYLQLYYLWFFIHIPSLVRSSAMFVIRCTHQVAFNIQPIKGSETLGVSIIWAEQLLAYIVSSLTFISMNIKACPSTAQIFFRSIWLCSYINQIGNL
jgi:hypothetical protein